MSRTTCRKPDGSPTAWWFSRTVRFRKSPWWTHKIPKTVLATNMRLTVKYMAQLKQAAGAPQEILDLKAGGSVQAALQALASRHGEHLRWLLFDARGNVHSAILLFVGEEQVAADRLLRDGDVLTLL